MEWTLVREHRCVTSWCDLDLTFDLAVVTLTYKILSGLYLRHCKVWEVNTWQGHWLVGVGVHWCAKVTLTYKILSGLYLGNQKV